MNVPRSGVCVLGGCVLSIRVERYFALQPSDPHLSGHVTSTLLRLKKHSYDKV